MISSVVRALVHYCISSLQDQNVDKSCLDHQLHYLLPSSDWLEQWRGEEWVGAPQRVRADLRLFPAVYTAQGPGLRPLQRHRVICKIRPGHRNNTHVSSSFSLLPWWWWSSSTGGYTEWPLRPRGPSGGASPRSKVKAERRREAWWEYTGEFWPEETLYTSCCRGKTLVKKLHQSEIALSQSDRSVGSLPVCHSNRSQRALRVISAQFV